MDASRIQSYQLMTVIGIVLILATASAGMAQSFDTGTLSDTYNFRNLTLQDFENQDGRDTATSVWGEIGFDGQGNWNITDLFRYLSDDRTLGPVSTSGTYTLRTGDTFTLQTTPVTHLAASPDTDILIGIQGDTDSDQGATKNALNLFTRKSTSFDTSDISGTYYARVIVFDDYSRVDGAKEAEILEGPTIFDGAGTWRFDLQTYASDNSFDSSNLNNLSYVMQNGETVSLRINPTQPRLNTAFTPDTNAYITIQGGRNTNNNHAQNSLGIGIRQRQTPWSQSDLSGTYIVQMLDVRDFEGRDGDTRVRSEWGKIRFDGQGNWNTNKLRVYGSNNQFSSEIMSGTYVVTNGETFVLHSDTVGIPSFNLALSPDTQVLAATRGDSNTVGDSFAHQSLLVGVRALTPDSADPDPDEDSSDKSGCLITQWSPSWAPYSAMRNVRDWMLKTKLGRVLVALNYR